MMNLPPNRYLLFLINCILIIVACSSLLPLAAQHHIVSLQHYGIEEGLSHRQVNSIVKDNRGFLWLGTPFGLNRFDGYTFKWWTEGNGLPNNNVQTLALDAAGDLWIIQSSLRIVFSTSQSISIMDTELEVFKTVEEKLGHEVPFPIQEIGKSIVKDKENVLYFGTGNGARMLSYHPATGFQIFPLKPFRTFLPKGVTSRQTIWGIANRNHLIEVSRKGEILQSHVHPHNLNWRNTVVIGNEVFFEGNEQREELTFCKIDENGQRLTLTDNQLPIPAARLNHKIKQLNYDPHQERLWMVSKELLPVVHLEEGKLLDFFDEYPHLIRDRSIGWRGMLFEPSGGNWLGGDYGLYQVNIHRNKFSRYLFEKNWGKEISSNTQDQVDNFSCRGIFADDQKLYVNTERKGLQIINIHHHKDNPEAVTKTINIQMVPEMNSAYALTKSRSGELWLGQYGLQRLDTKTELLENLYFNARNKLLEVIWAIYEDDASTLWLGGSNGLEYYNPKNNTLHVFENYNAFPELAKSDIIHIAEDRNKMIWICSNSGLYTLDTDRGITARYWSGGEGKYHLPFDHFYHFYHDNRGIYWLATAGGGLIRWDKKTGQFRQFTKVDGLANNVLYAIYEDEKEHLWMSSDYGIIQFDKNSFQSKAYLLEDGITHHEFNRVSHFQDADGRIYFGGLNGVTAFHPDDFYAFNTTHDAPLQITEFQQFDGSSNQLVDRTTALRQNGKIVLNPNDRFFQLGFSLLTYEAPDKLQYAYTIEGVDEDWTYLKEPSIRIGRLPYGKHKLKIKGQAANGQWSTQQLSIPIKVIPPFYLQNWFLVIAGISLLGLIVGIYKWRTWQYKQRQKKLEAEVIHQTTTIRQQSEKLKELDTMKSQFYTNITHEFRTPLTVIMGISDELAANSRQLTSSPDQQQKLTQGHRLISRNSKNLLRLINQLLDLSKIDSGMLKTNMVQADIIFYLRYLTESFYSMAKDKKIQLTFYSDLNTLRMDFDEEKMQHIVYNLLSNALKFTPTGGKVILYVQQAIQDTHPYLQIKVQDNGLGIPAEQLPHIFDRFYQADSSTTRKGEGTGIGLALTKELVEMMDGTIVAVSNSNSDKGENGTTFTVHLPIRQEAKMNVSEIQHQNAQPLTAAFTTTALPPQAIQPSPDTNENDRPVLLIIEDNHDVITYMVSILQNDYQIETAEDGQAGIETALETIPDIIITDVMMPRKDGFEVCQTLKSDARTSHIPIIMLTAKATREDRISGLKTGADAYLMKPFNRDELFIRLEKLLEIRKRLQEKYSAAAMHATSPSPTATPTLDDIFLHTIRQTIDEKISDAELGISDLCDAVHLSKTQVFRKMKALTGESPVRFIQKIRLYKAKELLTTTELSISEIAYDMGFTDPNYFSRAFSKEFGMPPSAVRETREKR